jgi:hypothetical protein
MLLSRLSSQSRTYELHAPTVNTPSSRDKAQVSRTRYQMMLAASPFELVQGRIAMPPHSS